MIVLYLIDSGGVILGYVFFDLSFILVVCLEGVDVLVLVVIVYFCLGGVLIILIIMERGVRNWRRKINLILRIIFFDEFFFKSK